MRSSDYTVNYELAKACRPSRTQYHLIFPGDIDLEIPKSFLYFLMPKMEAKGIKLEFETETRPYAGSWGPRRDVYIAVPVEAYLEQLNGGDFVQSATDRLKANTARNRFKV